MKPLIDCDILVYECAYGAQNRETGEIFSFEMVKERFDEKIAQICASVYATEPPNFYLTGGNVFRHQVARTAPYKGGRKEEKPWHYKNIRAYIQSLPNCYVTEGIEADDLICIHQTERLAFRDTIICTRDKDLRQCPGYHFGWEHAGQPEFFPQWVDQIGTLQYNEEKNTLKGTGLKFFYAQLIMGDTTDNIPGLPRGGPKLAWRLLSDVEEEGDMWGRVYEKYAERYPQEATERIMEQAHLLWMIRELDGEGNPVLFVPPEERTCR